MWLNVPELIILITPKRLCKPRLLQLLNVLAGGIQTIYVDWLTFRADSLFLSNENAQVCYLRALLNNRFDNALRRITIGDGQAFEQVYIYLDTEPEVLYLRHNDNDPSNPQVYLDRYANASNFDFIIYLNGVSLNADEVNSLTYLVNTFKLASKKWLLIA